jgi:hypothetical protein
MAPLALQSAKMTGTADWLKWPHVSPNNVGFDLLHGRVMSAAKEQSWRLTLAEAAQTKKRELTV